MPGAAYTTGALHRFYLKIETISDALKASVLKGDFMGAGKIIDATSEDTWNANYVELITPFTIGGEAKTDSWMAMGRGEERQIIVGETILPMDLVIKANRQDAIAKAVEDVAVATDCWYAFLRQLVNARGIVDATLNVGWGTLTSKLDANIETASECAATMAVIEHKKAIDV